MIDKMNTFLSPNRFIPNDYEELSALELIGKQNVKIDEVIDGHNSLSKEKLDINGDFTGSWFGITKPVYSDPGIANVVEKLENHDKIKTNVDDFPTLESAFNFANENGVILVFSPKTYVVEKTLTFDISKSSIEGNGCKLNSVNGCGDLTVLKVFGSGDSPYYQNGNFIRDIEFIGSGNQVAIHFNSDHENRATSHVDIKGLNIHGYNVGIKYDSFSYLIRHYSCDIFNCNICVLMDAGGEDYGENINFYGCAFYNSKTCVKGLNPNGAFHFNSCSIDYSNTFFDVTNNNKCFFQNGHIEGSGVIKGSLNITNSWLVLLWENDGYFDVSNNGVINVMDSFVNTNAIGRRIAVGDGVVRFSNINHQGISDLVTNKLNKQSSMVDDKTMNIFATDGTGENTSQLDRPNCTITYDRNQFFYTVTKEYGAGSQSKVSILFPKSSKRIALSYLMRSNKELVDKVSFILYECTLQHTNGYIFKPLYSNKLKEATINNIYSDYPREYSLFLNDVEAKDFSTHFVLELNLFNCDNNTQLFLQNMEVYNY